ncbi:MAG: hypothetical protein R2729_13895 [Bryobacteraceae bacterium]
MRGIVIAAIVALVSCGSGSTEFAMPEQAGEWVRQGGANAMEAAYRKADGVLVTVRVERMAEGTAFERVQKSRPEPGSIFFHHGEYFVTVRGDGAGNETLNGFASAFEKSAHW